MTPWLKLQREEPSETQNGREGGRKECGRGDVGGLALGERKKFDAWWHRSVGRPLASHWGFESVWSGSGDEGQELGSARPVRAGRLELFPRNPLGDPVVSD